MKKEIIELVIYSDIHNNKSINVELLKNISEAIEKIVR